MVDSFFSTTLKREVALAFADPDNPIADDSVRVLFRLDIDVLANVTKPWACLVQYSKYPDESEYLLSMGILFLIESIEEDVNVSIKSIQKRYLTNLQLAICRRT